MAGWRGPRYCRDPRGGRRGRRRAATAFPLQVASPHPPPRPGLQGGASGASTITVALNGAPVCTLGAGCAAAAAGASAPAGLLTTALGAPAFGLQLGLGPDLNGGVSVAFPDSTVTLSAPPGAWADPDGDALLFEFGTLDEETGARAPRATRPEPAFAFGRLPPGEHGLYMCAVDARGARSCEDARARVAAPPGAPDGAAAGPAAALAGAALWDGVWAGMQSDLEAAAADAEALAQIGFQMAGIWEFLERSGLPPPAGAEPYGPNPGAGARGEGAAEQAPGTSEVAIGDYETPASERKTAKALLAPLTGVLPAALAPSNLVRAMAAAANGTASPGVLGALVAAVGQLAAAAPIDAEAGLAAVKLCK